MGISKQFLKEQAKRIETNYGKDRFVMNPDIFDLWYEMFADCDEEGLRLAVTKCIKESEFPPNIAGLMKYYRQLDEERCELGETIKAQYRKMRSFWGEEYDKETHQAIIEYLMRFPKKTRKVEMIELSQRAISFSFNCDGCGRKDKPTIKEYIEGER